MKGALLILVLAAVVCTACAQLKPQPYKPRPYNPPANRPPVPKPRLRREANPGDNGHISITQTKSLSGPERRPSYSVDYQHNIWQNRDGYISAGGGAQKLPGQRWEPTIGVQGSWRFKREDGPSNGHGQISITQTKPLSGPERRPSYNVDYSHNIYKGRNGEISAGGGAQKLPGQRWEPTIGVQGRWRF